MISWPTSAQVSAGCAAVALIVSVGVGWYNYAEVQAQESRITAQESKQVDGAILSLSAHDATVQAEVSSYCVLASGYQYKVPADGDLWLVLRAVNNDLYYPTRVRPGDTPTSDQVDAAKAARSGGVDAWQAAIVVGQHADPDSKPYALTLYYATSGQSADMQALLAAGADGLSRLPTNMVELNTTRLVKAGRQGSDPTAECSVPTAR
jgi:hypothetical protein